jgi:hypothetical protein
MVYRLQSPPAVKAGREMIPGSGLSVVGYLALVALSIALFVVWGGLLWDAPREASHVGRFVFSYLAVVPLAAALLALSRRFSWAHLVTSTGAVWAVKLVLTAVIYQAVARGTATRLVAVAPRASAPAPAARTAEYRAAADFTATSLRGALTRSGRPVRGALVFLDAPAPGLPAPAGKTVDLVIRGSRYAEPVYVISTADDARILNKDSVLHTLHFRGAGQTPANHPLPPSAAPQRLDLPETGLYEIRCDNHAGEGAWVLVVDHPYVTRSGEDGSFSLEGVPLGAARVVAVMVDGEGIHRASRQIIAGTTAPLRVEFDEHEEAAF